MDTKRSGGRIEQWLSVPNSDGFVVMGIVYDDPVWADGTSIRTSKIESFFKDLEGLTIGVVTRNTIYSLGKRYEEV